MNRYLPLGKPDSGTKMGVRLEAGKDSAVAAVGQILYRRTAPWVILWEGRTYWYRGLIEGIMTYRECTAVELKDVSYSDSKA